MTHRQIFLRELLRSELGQRNAEFCYTLLKVGEVRRFYVEVKVLEAFKFWLFQGYMGFTTFPFTFITKEILEGGN